MNVLVLMVFVSLSLVGGAVLALLLSVKQGDPDHADRLSLLPVEEERRIPHP